MKNTIEFTLSTTIKRELGSSSTNIVVHGIRLTNTASTTERTIRVTLGTSSSTKHIADVDLPGHTSIELLHQDLPLSRGKGLYFITSSGTDVEAVVTYSNY